MNIITNIETTAEIKKVLDANPDQPKNVRLFIDGHHCSGPSFGLALDNVKENDMQYSYDDLLFVMDKEIFEEYGDMSVDFAYGGYAVKPVKELENSGCASCSSGSCSI